MEKRRSVTSAQSAYCVLRTAVDLVRLILATETIINLTLPNLYLIHLVLQRNENSTTNSFNLSINYKYDQPVMSSYQLDICSISRPLGWMIRGHKIYLSIR